jgi:Uma2 family endonuclease
MGMAISVPRLTVDDLEQLPEDGNRYELLDGMLIVTPAPRLSHQVIAGRIQSRLAVNLQDVAHVVGPGVVTLRPATQLEPDVLVYPSRFSPMLHWADISGHWLAVEVLSRSSRMYDREFKRDAYFALGVPEVWLADRWELTVEVCKARGRGKIVRDALRWRAPSVNVMVTIDLTDVFAGLA